MVKPKPLSGRQLEPKREFWPRGIDIGSGLSGITESGLLTSRELLLWALVIPSRIILAQRATKPVLMRIENNIDTIPCLIRLVKH